MGALLDLSGYTLTFRDEFNAFSWNSNSRTSYADAAAANGTWSTRFWWGDGERNLPGNGEMQWYSDPSVGADPLSIVDGALRITATRSADPAATGGFPYVSGLVTSEGTFSQQYGYFEMRAKLPAGQGLWPQWWLLAQDHSWPPELDPLEAFGSEPNRYHWATHTGPDNDGEGGWVDVLDDLTNSFHAYGVEWTAETVTYYFDGREVASVATPSDMHKPMYLVMNLAVGGPWAGDPFPYTAFPAHMDIDHVRVYSADPSAVEAAPQAVSAPDAVPRPTAAAAARSAAPAQGRAPSQTMSDTAGTGTPGDDLFPTGYGDVAPRSGGAGDDTYVVSDSRMPVLESAGEGTDAVVAWMNHTLPPNVENVSVGADYGLHVQGNALSNIVAGNAGDDWLNGRAGDDALFGGGGSDTFLVNAGNGHDTITDFQAGAGAGRDRLVLDGYGLKDFADVEAVLEQVGADAVLALDNGETVVFRGVPASSFAAENFAFTRVSAGPATAGPVSLTAGSGPDSLVLKMSQDAYQGSAQYTVSVDGAQVGGTFTAGASRAAAQSDTLTLKGDWSAGEHKVEVVFLNDAWGGTAETDRNLYVDAATYNGEAVAGAVAALMSAGAAGFAFTEAAAPMPAPANLAAGAGADALVLRISQDAYEGSAQYAVKVDGAQVGGVFTASALHGSGQSDTLTLKGDWAAGEHRVSVEFLNDAWGGSAETDRNLYVDAATYNGQAVGGAARALLSNGAAGFAFADAVAPVAKTGTDGADLFDATEAGGLFTGGGGRDLFVFEEGDGAATIADFASRADRLVFVGLGRAEVSAEAATAGPPGLTVHYGGAGGSVFLAGVSALVERDMVFA